MAVTLKKILCSFNGHRDRDFVFGYIKQFGSVNDIIVPDIVMHVVLSYYHIFSDEWDCNAMGDNMEVSEDNILHKTSDLHHYQSTFLKGITSTGMYKWRFRIIDYNHWNSHYNYLIGIWMIDSPKSTDDLVNDYVSRDCKHMYGYLAACGLKVLCVIEECIAK